MNEAHIQHTVGFIQYQNLNLIQLHGILMFQVEQTSRRRHQHIHAAAQFHHLRIDAYAAKYHQRANVEIFTVISDVFANLRRQLAGWREDQRAHRATTFSVRLMGNQMLQQWQGKTRRFTGSGLSAGHQIAAFQHGGNRLLLNRGRFTVTLLGNGAQDIRV
ncbi:Uncharacterised protein [Salmonella enterica subsp. enterica serovar Bovismorbificans]|uniref:Uncharacterized protein n=1 Tax=Salmonella enterica subsp. enterica serovar Bovismorbificans TaxID=58097 RepID=A0A655BN80_SALET|nr:Uncharacterised protein [Salmonella enterica subsp. enterica serovar Bovismorbificans]CNT96758.1 Uncharacterised protein [Salmonella enterica subsp. enterica serovar Bovismorbificans]